MAYRDRTDILDRKYAVRVNAGGGILKPVIVVRGEVVGTWQRTIGKRGVIDCAAFFKRVSPADRDAFDAAAARYGQFLGMSVVAVR